MLTTSDVITSPFGISDGLFWHYGDFCVPRKVVDRFRRYNLITVHKRSLRRLCFYTCRLSVILFMVGESSCIQGEFASRGGSELEERGWADPHPIGYYGLLSMSGWYASYWNAFLFQLNSYQGSVQILESSSIYYHTMLWVHSIVKFQHPHIPYRYSRKMIKTTKGLRIVCSLAIHHER